MRALIQVVLGLHNQDQSMVCIKVSHFSLL